MKAIKPPPLYETGGLIKYEAVKWIGRADELER